MQTKKGNVFSSTQETVRPAAGNGGAGTERVELPGEIRKPGIEAMGRVLLGAGLWEQLWVR